MDAPGGNTFLPSKSLEYRPLGGGSLQVERSSPPIVALKTKRIGEFTLAGLALILVISGAFLVAFSALSISVSRSQGVATERVIVGPDPGLTALHLTPDPGQPLGTVVMVHGFAATKEYLRDIGYTVARGGFDVYLVDLPGHGESPERFDQGKVVGWLGEVLGGLEAAGRLRGDGFYLVGHSLASLVVTDGAVAAGASGLPIRAVVALSPIQGDITPTEPPNFLALTGQGELPGVKGTALTALRNATGLDEPALDTLYGDVRAGTGRLVSEVEGATHDSIAFSELAIAQVVEWLYASAGQADRELPRIEELKAERGMGGFGAGLLWLGIFYLGAGALGLLGFAPRRPESVVVVEAGRVADGLPPRPAPRRAGTPEPPLKENEKAARAAATRLLAGTRLYPLFFVFAGASAVAFTAFVGRFAFLGQAVTDYLAAYWVVFTVVLTILALLLGRLLKTGPLLTAPVRSSPLRSALLGLALFAVLFVLLGYFATHSWTNVIPTPARWGQILVLALLLAPFAAVDEMIRATTHDRVGLTWAIFVTTIGKLIMVLSWYAALVLPNAPFTLLVVIPIIARYLVALDLITGLVYNEHGTWIAGAVFKTLVLAWTLGTVFPLLAQPLAF